MSRARTTNKKAQELLRIADQLAGKGHAYPTRAVAAMLVLGSVSEQKDPGRSPLTSFVRTGLEAALEEPRTAAAALQVQWQNWRGIGNRASLFPDEEPFRGFPSGRLATAAEEVRDLLEELSAQEEHSVGGLFDLFLSKLGEHGNKVVSESTTPRPVNDLLVRLADLRRGMVVGDFYAGVGGTLVSALAHVGVPDWGEAPISGAEINEETVFLARVNLLLHGADPALVRWENTISSWRPTDGQGQNFDRVLSNPPFGLYYDRAEYRAPQGLLGITSRSKSELMMLQQMRASVRPGGRAIMAMAHGPLFRGGPEEDIRRALLERGEIEAVVGIGPNLFPGTGLPACLLVLRKPESDLQALNDVLLINAEREVETGRSKNRLEPRHIEKIARVFHQRAELPGFSRLVSFQELIYNSFDLNIRRYVEPRAEQLPAPDLGAMVGGGVPQGEVELARAQFRAFELEPEEFFEPKDNKTLVLRGTDDFDALAQALSGLCAPAVDRVCDELGLSWLGIVCDAFPQTTRPTFGTFRQALVDGLCAQLVRAEVLDEYEIAGAFGQWWNEHAPQIWHHFQEGRRAVVDLIGDRLVVSLSEELSAMVGLRQKALQRTVRGWGERYGHPLTELLARSERADRKFFASLERIGGELDYGFE